MVVTTTFLGVVVFLVVLVVVVVAEKYHIMTLLQSFPTESILEQSTLNFELLKIKRNMNEAFTSTSKIQTFLTGKGSIYYAYFILTLYYTF